MTEKVKNRLRELWSRDYRALRNMEPEADPQDELKFKTLPTMAYVADHFVYAMSLETPPVLHGEDPIGFYHRCSPLFCRKAGHSIRGNNVTVDYESFLAEGLNGFRRRISACEVGADEQAQEFYRHAKACLDACEAYVLTTREVAGQAGADELYGALCQVPMNGARTYHEALVSVKFIQYILRVNQNDHLTLGRFDQYMKPYFDASRKDGATDEELLELTELFFLSLNFDSDLYFGCQQGDNGQSMVLGGYNADGNSAYNDLTEICLSASEELRVIDPKINLRVNKTTPLSLYERGTRLTKQGLGFPQYLNDDIIVPGLIALGYDPKDAWNYSVAACWEPIIPRFGNDVPNVTAMNFPAVVREVTLSELPSCDCFADFREKVQLGIEKACDEKIEDIKSKPKKAARPDALFSLFLLPCIESGRDIGAYGTKYNNYGMHGTGIAPAADALEAIERAVFLDKTVSAKELIAALEADFVGFEDLQKQLLAYPKMGNNEDSVDEKAAFLMDTFQKKLNHTPNGKGGIWRAGTGSALEYYRSAYEIGATADGRNAGVSYGANFSPSLTARVQGPLSAIQSFTKYNLKNIINGGPYTMEIHDTVFRNEEGEKKVAMLVKSYIDLGGHQIQINAINREVLLDAQKHPENYPNLIVRVWGWSGYFNELEQPYQEHIIRRTEFTV